MKASGLFVPALLLVAGCRGKVMDQNFHLLTGTWESQQVEVTTRSRVTAKVVETTGHTRPRQWPWSAQVASWSW